MDLVQEHTVYYEPLNNLINDLCFSSLEEENFPQREYD